MNENFAGQQLNNRSFRGQNLTGVDFSDCTLNSCDFRDADLTDATFKNAVFGVSLKWQFVKILAGLLMGGLSGLLVVLGVAILYTLNNEIAKVLDISLDQSIHVAIFNIIVLAGFLASLMLSLRQKRWNVAVGTGLCVP